MSDWQKGDLALCVRADGGGGLPYIQRGEVHVVSAVFRGVEAAPEFGEYADGDALHFVGRETPDYAYAVEHFAKVTPRKADEFDREVIDLMAGKKVDA